ncbi:MAG: CHAT domain-containing protein [Leptolyngbyaceae cyanobacterium bins.302]|nr:CHAT domain-containing protein [Leptolyngbyaceae cyanobacterium bins.302]
MKVRSPRRWLVMTLGILSVWMAIVFHPAQASLPSFYSATPSSVAAPTIASTFTNWLEQGRNLYQTGKFADAVSAWQEAVRQYQTTGDRENQALSLGYLSLAHQELGQWDEAQRTIAQSLTLLQAENKGTRAIVWAQVLNAQASLLLHRGQAETALETWKQAQQYYDQAGDATGSLGSQINQARALQRLGFYRRARQQLEVLNQKLATLPDSEMKVSGLQALGSVLEQMGDVETSQTVLMQGLKVAQQSGTKPDLNPLLLGLGKTAADLGDPETAYTYFQQAEQTTINEIGQLQARLSQLRLLIEYGKLAEATPLAQQILQQLKTVSTSHDSLYSAINLVATLNKLENPAQIVPLSDLAHLMAATVKAAQRTQDTQAEAYALGQWGQLYSRTQQSAEAQQVITRSLILARQLQANPIIAQSAWQLGRLYRQQGKRSEAIAAYTEAVKSLQAIRSDLVAVNSEVQFSFRESVEPVYRELVGLLLNDTPSQSALTQARDLIESLQVAELDDFFREACMDKAQQIDQVDPTATIIYPIILPDRLAVILSNTGQPLRYYVTPKSQKEVNQTLDRLLASLNPVSDYRERQQLSNQVYNWLIAPAEADQVLARTKTLVFVLDGRLRNIPMAALYDGQRYLIEKYAVTLSPGLQLMATRSLNVAKRGAIVGGISQPHAGFAGLPAVETEVKEIAQIISTTQMLNQDFTRNALADRIRSSKAPIIHLATHGQFSSRLEDTFLLTWDGRVNVKELSTLLQSREQRSSNAIELLVLSACNTATGDDRAVLGLAGLTVKSGAYSTLATLWPVKDKAAALLMTNFYRQLQQPHVTRSEALRQAQLELIHKTDFREPFFWAAFVLVGNWV